MMLLRTLSIALAALVIGAAPPQASAPPTAHRMPPRGYGDPAQGRKKVLFVADLNTGVPMAHDWSASRAAAVLEQIGHDTGDFDLYVQSDTELVTKGKVYGGGEHAQNGPHPTTGRNLDYFDAVVFFTNGDLNMSDQQLKDLLSFVHDDGKGFVGIHTATVTLTQHPEYGDMIGAYFDNHPWGITTAPILVEDPTNPAMAKFKTGAKITDEFYQMKAPYDRSKVDVLARLDTSKLDLKNPNVHRTDGDFPVAWIKSYGKGRVFYSDLGHPVASWDDPRIRDMYLKGIRWALGETQMNVHPHPMASATK
ncbi:ThuA domain-containing protein [Sphingomonas koreensis]|nr:ThuA domain-containing protein [Sphingomonas koreensis]